MGVADLGSTVGDDVAHRPPHDRTARRLERMLDLARDAFVEIDHPVAGRFKYPQHLVSMTATPPIPARAPMLGEHNTEILDRLGISRDQQQGLRAAGVI